MKEEDILKEAIEIDERLSKEPEKKNKNLWAYYIVLALFLAFIVIIMIVPYSAVKLDPEPVRIPTVAEVYSGKYVPANKTVFESKKDFLVLLVPNDSQIKNIADSIANEACPNGNKICYSKAMYYFVRNDIQYINDPPDEYLKHPLETLTVKVGDCDDHAILLANLLEAIGFRTRFVFIPEHVYLQVYFPDAPKKYRVDNWVSLDPTCEYCEFGEIPVENKGKESTFL